MVDRAWVDSYTLLSDGMIFVSLSASSTKTINRYITGFAVAVHGVRVEDFIAVASITVGFVTVFYLDGWSAVIFAYTTTTA